MNLQGNGNNHNYKPNENGDGDSFLKFGDSEQFEKITGQHPAAVETDGTVEFGSEEDERKRKLREAIERENSSAYDDLDDFIYKQNKRRARTSGRRHHHRHISASRLSPGRVRNRHSDKKPHKHRHHYRKHHHKKKRLKRWQKIILGILISLLSIIVIGIIVILIMFSLGKNELLDKSGFNVDPPAIADSVEENGNIITYKGKRYHYNDNITTILCMGIDKKTDAFKVDENEYATGGQADSLFLLSMNLETGENRVINISRETMTEVNQYTSAGKVLGSKVEQICLAYAYGDGAETSCQNELVAVRRLFYNLPINSYFALNINGIVPINDALGGVTVVSPETIAEFTEGETYTLRGSLAQSFVQARSHETYAGNNLRMERQKAYLNSFALNLMTKTRSDLTAPLNIYNVAKPYVVSDITANRVTFLAVNALRDGFSELNVENVPGTVKQGKKFAEFYVNEKEFFELFLDTYYIPE